MKCCGPKTRYSILLVVGIIFIVLPLALHQFINKTIRKEIADNLKIEPGSQIYNQWQKPTIPVYLQIYTFNIENHLEVKEGKPPVVIEKGPYSYRETKEKLNISWGDDNVTYNQVSRYVFDPETSCKSCDPQVDNFTTINIPLVAITQLLMPFRDILEWKEIASFIAKYIVGEQLFITKTVNETIWGYDEPLFEVYNYLRDILVNLPQFKNLPVIPPVFTLQPNPNYDGVTTVMTGQSNIDDVGRYKEWKGYTTLPYWQSRIANMLNGTDGAIYKPHITKDDALYIFIAQLCRSLAVTYLSESKIQGISALRFHPPVSTFTSGNINPDNKGFCNPNCLPSGLLSVNACVPFNAPIVVSSPHFLNGDPNLLKTVLGLHPDKEKHDTFVHLEPNTGVLLQASKRIQFNIHVEPVHGFTPTEGLTPTHVPIMWVNEHVSIDSKNANKLKKDVLVKLEIIKWVQIGLYILGSLMVLIALILLFRLCFGKKDATTPTLLADDGHDYGETSSGLDPSIINASD